MEDYKYHLLKQFSNSKGYDYITTDDESYLKEFKMWLSEMRAKTVAYVNFAAYNGLNLIGNDVVELDKGANDLISRENKLVSRFGYTIKDEDMSFEVNDGEPYFITFNKTGDGFTQTKGEASYTYSLHNPYDEKLCPSLCVLMDNGFQACLGVFGNLFDKDKKRKIYTLEKYYADTFNNSKCDYAELDGDYFAMIYTKFDQRIREPRKR